MSHAVSSPVSTRPARTSSAPVQQREKNENGPMAAKGFGEAARNLEPNPGALDVVRKLLGEAERNENVLTNEAFWAGHPELRGQKLAAGTPEAQAWLRVRDEVVRPALKTAVPPKPAAAPVASGGSAKDAKDAKPAAKPEPKPEPKDKEAAKPAVPGATASSDDKYYCQGDNSYDDDEANWLNGSAAANTCNMTALVMALVSMAGEAKVREGLAALCRKKGSRAGAKIKAGTRSQLVTTVLKTPALLALVQLEDLAIAAAVKSTDSYKGVTFLGTIMKIAKESGIASAARTAKETEEDLWKPEAREAAKAALAKGQRVVCGTINHFVYLTEVRDDGIVVHDPAGLRATTKEFLHAGTPLKRGRSGSLGRTTTRPRSPRSCALA